MPTPTIRKRTRAVTEAASTPNFQIAKLDIE